MKKKYTIAEMEIEYLEVGDIICSSQIGVDTDTNSNQDVSSDLLE